MQTSVKGEGVRRGETHRVLQCLLRRRPFVRVGVEEGFDERLRCEIGWTIQHPDTKRSGRGRRTLDGYVLPIPIMELNLRLGRLPDEGLDVFGAEGGVPAEKDVCDDSVRRISVMINLSWP